MDKKHSNKFKQNDIKANYYAIGSFVMITLSVGAYFLSGAIDREYILSPTETQYQLIMVAIISSISTLAAIIAIFKVPGWWKLLFIVFLLISLAETIICLTVASLIGAIG